MTTQTKPSLEELEGRLRDKDQVLAMIKEGQFPDFVKDYADAKNAANTDILAQVKEETQLQLSAWLKENGQAQRLDLNPLEDGAVAAKRSGVYNAKAPGAKLDKQFADSAEFFQSIWHHVGTLSNSQDLMAKTSEARKIQNSFGSIVPADGGFLIPEELRSEVLRLALEASVVRSRARVIPMSSLTLPFPSIDDTSHASSVFGGLVGYWTEEGATLTESQATFGRIKLEAKKLTIYSEAPNELVADAPAFGMLLDEILPQAVAFYEDVAFVKGSGVGEPLGVLNGACAIAPTRVTANEVGFVDIVNMYTRMLPASLNSAVWLISPAVVAQLLQLVLTVAAGDSVSPPLWLTNQQAISGPTLSLLGRPVIVSEKVPDLGTTGDITFVDFGYYLIGDRQVMQATSSPHFKFQNDVTAYRIVERVDGRPWLNSAITPENGGDTLSPIVTLSSDVTP